MNQQSSSSSDFYHFSPDFEGEPGMIQYITSLQLDAVESPHYSADEDSPFPVVCQCIFCTTFLAEQPRKNEVPELEEESTVCSDLNDRQTRDKKKLTSRLKALETSRDNYRKKLKALQSRLDNIEKKIKETKAEVVFIENGQYNHPPQTME